MVLSISVHRVKTSKMFHKFIVYLIFFSTIPTHLLAQAEKCADLSFKRAACSFVDDGKKIILDLTIVNTGINVVHLPNSSALIIKAFWSGNALYDAGDQAICETTVHNFGEYGVNLSPDGEYKLKMECTKKHKNRYTNNLVLLLDSSFRFEECTEQNNTVTFLIKN